MIEQLPSIEAAHLNDLIAASAWPHMEDADRQPIIAQLRTLLKVYEARLIEPPAPPAQDPEKAREWFARIGAKVTSA